MIPYTYQYMHTFQQGSISRPHPYLYVDKNVQVANAIQRYTILPLL